MTIQEKLKVLMQDRKFCTVAKRAGVHPITLSSYINRGVIPGTDVAVKLADSLAVDVGWLVDPKQGLPIVHAEPTSI